MKKFFVSSLLVVLTSTSVSADKYGDASKQLFKINRSATERGGNCVLAKMDCDNAIFGSIPIDRAGAVKASAQCMKEFFACMQKSFKLALDDVDVVADRID